MKYQRPTGNSTGLVTLPAGEYYIGDPCYVIHDDEWMPFLEANGLLDNDGFHPACEYHDKPCFVSSTMYGDGTYPVWGPVGQKPIGVDAGLLSAVPSDLVADRGEAERLGFFVTFAEDFACGWEDGTIIFGDYRIATGDDDENPDDDYWWDDDYDQC